MQYQHTLKEKIELWGIEPFGGCSVHVCIEPAPPATGRVFYTKKGEIPATLDYAEPLKGLASFLTLKNKGTRIFIPEHLLAILFGYGIDNVKITLEKIPSKSSKILKYFGKAKNAEAVPYLGKKLCDALNDNMEEQDKPRKILRLEKKIETEKLKFKQIEENNMIVKVITDYKLARGKRIKQEKELIINPETIKDISTSRSYCSTPLWFPKFLTKVAGYSLYLSFGFGYGSDESNLFYPQKTKEKWMAQELMENEIACHAILDRIGELSLLPGRLEGVHVYCKFAGHKDVLKTLKINRDKFYEE